MERGNFGGGHARNGPRDRLRAEAGRIDHEPRADPQGICASGLDYQPRRTGLAAEDQRLQRQHRPVPLGVAERRQYESVAVDVARGRRKQRPLRDQRGFEPPRLGAAEPDEIRDAIGFGLCL